MRTDWLLWQLADSAFPVGGFGHSSGLEGASQHREVRNGDDLIAFIQAVLVQARRGALPFVKAAHQRERALPDLDRMCDAFLSNHVANRASRVQGQAFLASATRSFGTDALKTLRTLVLQEGLPGHWPCLFGAVTARLGLELPDTLRLFVFMQLRGMISAAVRLGIVGPLEGQGIQHGLSLMAEDAAIGMECLSLDGIAQTAPLLDLFQGTQDRLYSRLFQS
ncbi:MAG: hypothetical protein L0Z50_35695 [Verrucomicrobiales bacterium]|nr:hypothetical protein [Verrucomicrobiales bacterium]